MRRLGGNTNSGSIKRQAVAAYRHRMWIKEMFGDFKYYGLNLEAIHLQHFARLSRLMLAVVLLYIWLLAVGAATIMQRLRHLVDCRDLSLFRIGCGYLKHCLKSWNCLPNAFLTTQPIETVR